MPVVAVRLAGVGRAHAHPRYDVGSVRLQAEVVKVDAGGVAAAMVKFQPRRDRPECFDPKPTVGADGLALDVDVPVAVGQSCRPLVAAAVEAVRGPRTFEIHLLPEPFCGRTPTHGS